MATTTFRDELDQLHREQTAGQRHRQLVGRNIRDRRRERGLSQQRLALMMDLHEQTDVSAWENGHHQPNAVSLERLARALDCHWTDFYARRPET
jgi:transcriptional regulator with XRE-family HTH domain